MIEIVYEKEKQKPEGNQEFFRIPNNIRQIGEIEGIQKIYIEDYAYTYLCRIASEDFEKNVVAILLGQVYWKDGVSYLFVKSAVRLLDMEVSEEHVSFTQENWNHVYEKTKEYFARQEIVGWFLSMPGCPSGLSPAIHKAQMDYFGGSEKVLFFIEPLEKEEAFYRYEDGKMSRQAGFYVYYEKNESMRDYLVSQNEKKEQKTEEVNDEAVHIFRRKVEKKSAKKKEKQGFPLFKTASTCTAVAVLAVGVLYLNDYQKLKSTKEVISELETEISPAPSVLNDLVEIEKGEKTEEKTEEIAEEIPVDTPSYQSYTIQPGDTMTKISIKNYGTIKKIKEICELNEMSENDTIYPGQTILLP